MDPPAKYLNEHLSGAGAALDLLRALAKGDPSAGSHYSQLHSDILKNRLTLETLMDQAGFKRAQGMKLAARMASKLAQVRFRLHGLEPGSLGLVEALEALELGVHGQTLLWLSLMDMEEAFPVWKGTDFPGLLQSARNQKAVVESLRMSAVRAAFVPR